MKINDNSVSGIFIYTDGSSQVEFEKNDFVVSGDCIYICTAENPTNPLNNTVSGIDPKEDTKHLNFRPYPGSMIQDADEFFSYINSTSGKDVNDFDDKYVSSRSLVGILQRFQFGLSMTGVIEDYIDSEGTSSLELSSATSNPLDDLMLTKDLNNGIIKVSPYLSQIVDGVVDVNGENIPFSSLFGKLDCISLLGSGENSSNLVYTLLLKQYTYISSNNTKTRIQELISPVSGVTVYRHMSWEYSSIQESFPENGGLISEWISAYNYLSTLETKLNTLLGFYNDYNKRLKSEINSLRGSFRFREYTLSPGSGEISVLNNIDLTPDMFTLVISTRIGGGQVKQESIVIHSSDFTTSGSTFVLSNISCSVTVSSSSGKGIIELSDNSCFISSLYYKENLIIEDQNE